MGYNGKPPHIAPQGTEYPQGERYYESIREQADADRKHLPLARAFRNGGQFRLISFD